jgi:hypothetical protein
MSRQPYVNIIHKAAFSQCFYTVLHLTPIVIHYLVPAERLFHHLIVLA